MTNAIRPAGAMPRRSRRLRTAAAAALAAVLSAASAAPASAGSSFHLRLVSSDPAADATLAAPPAALRLTFSEAPELAVTTVRLRGPGDRAVALGRLVRARGDRATVVATPRAPLGHGRYALTWRTMSHDGHAMHGTFHFTVGGPGPGHSH
ncbi:MAG TPA: copper resistance protein CopC [Longimicrobium sp.]|nr:copper resistance protein CopC [Longimicrobium sp.]